jgi:hypothetical protein
VSCRDISLGSRASAALSSVKCLKTACKYTIIMTSLDSFLNPFAVILSMLQGERACGRLRCRLGGYTSDLCRNSVPACVHARSNECSLSVFSKHKGHIWV